MNKAELLLVVILPRSDFACRYYWKPVGLHTNLSEVLKIKKGQILEMARERCRKKGYESIIKVKAENELRLAKDAKVNKSVFRYVQN